MAKIVLGIGTSHGPMLSTPWTKWGDRVEADKNLDEHDFRGKKFSYKELVELRKNENLGEQITAERWKQRSKACKNAIHVLSTKYREVAPDVAVIIGNDQRELFLEDNIPAISIFWGEKIQNRPRTKNQISKLPPGIAISERGHAPPKGATYPGHPKFGFHLNENLIEQNFDVAASSQLPSGSGYVNGIPHAFGFIYRQIMKDQVIPNVPIILNTFYAPNQPNAARCYALGKSLKLAIDSWDSNARVAVFASGGLSHFVIDEMFDQKFLSSLKKKNTELLTKIPESVYQSGTSEIKNWIPVSAIMEECDKEMTLVDYVPCYRSEAGTGNAMGFVYWE